MSKTFELETNDANSPNDFWLVRDDDEFASHLAKHIFVKSVRRKLPLSDPEQNIWDLEWLYSNICGEGFSDLFYQQYSLADCARVESCMRELDLHRLADWFAEAKAIYCRHRSDLTEEEYRQLEPFSLSDTEGRRLDEIGELFIGTGSQLFGISGRMIRAYANRHRSAIT